MATEGQKEDGCSLVDACAVTLEDTGRDPCYIGIVVSGDMIVVIDGNSDNVRLHRRQDGKLLATTHKLESWPLGICLINDMEICVILRKGQIVIMSVHATYDTGTITPTRTLHVNGGLNFYDRVVKFKDNVVVCGPKQDTLCWCIVSLNDGHVDTIYQICNRYLDSYLTTKDNMIYISCKAGQNSPDNGVYAYNIQNPSKQKYIYKHKDLKEPRGITVDTHGFIFVCNYGSRYLGCPDSIHHLTDKCELVSIYRQGIPRFLRAIFWDQEHRHLYVTCGFSKVITGYRPEYQDPVILEDVLKMDKRSLDMYKEALRDGKEKVYNIRVMVVGQYGVGKTTLTKRLLGGDVEISDRISTEGIDVNIDCSKVSLTTGKWTKQEKNAEKYSRLQRLVKLLNQHIQKQESKGELEGRSDMGDEGASEEHDNGHPRHDQSVGTDQEINQKIKSNSFEPIISSVVSMGPKASSEIEFSENVKKKDTVMEILQLVNEYPNKLDKSMVEYAALSMWDFAGQYVFYSTHQTFLTSHAIYLLVLDLSQQVTDLIRDDECYLDTEGTKQCKVHDLIKIWLNSIHSCAPSPKAGIPAVILVGTHVDKIPEKVRQKVIDEYFTKLRYMLRDEPGILHLKDDIAIDNTQCDPKLEELKQMIFKLASKQSHWGEERPARWLPLEQAIMKLKASGVKIAPLSLVEEINRSGSVKIESKDELDLFLRFQHEMGTILYFSVEGLREKIVLDALWLIDALKSLITAEMFIIKNPAITSKWLDLKKNGTLPLELIDALWTKETNPDFHDNKEHILLLMEQLNIIAKPMLYSDDESEIKCRTSINVQEENYFLAPCMLCQKTPTEVICPKLHHQMENSSVLCYVFKEKFLPSPIFHRLLAACIAHWPIATQKKKNLIFCGCCVFQLVENHKLTLHFREYVIFVRITRKGISEKTLSSKLCIEVRKFITAMLFKIIGCLGQSLKFEHSIQCPECSADSISGLIPVSQLLENAEVKCDFHDNMIESYKLWKFWFDDVASRGTKGGNTETLGSMSMGEIPTEAKKKHNELFVALDELITKDLFKNIQRMSLTYLCRKTMNTAQDMDQLLSDLEANDVLRVGKYDKLIKIITLAGGVGRGIIETINKTAKDIEDIMQNRTPSQEQSETSSLDTGTSSQDRIYPSSGAKGQKRSSFDDQDAPASKRNLSKPQETLGSTSICEIPTEAKKKHNELYVALDDHITEDLFQKIKGMARTYLGPKTVEKVQDMDTLLSYLEANDVIRVGKYDNLIKIITLAGEVGSEIIKIINKTAKDIEDIMHTCIASQEQSETSSPDTDTSNQDRIHSTPE